MLQLIQAIILSVLQGLAEWLPISSSGHLALVQNIFGFQNLSFDVFLHIASILAVIVIFYKDIIRLFYPWKKSNLNYLLFLIIAIIPAAIVGVLFKDYIESVFSNPLYIGIFFIASGILIYSTKKYKEHKENLNFFDSIFIGLFQAISILPGISRSGATISSGLFRGLKKHDAIKFSFFLAIPLVLGAGILQTKEFVLSNIDPIILIVSFAITFIVSLFSIKFLLKVINKEKFYLFGIYNIILGIIVILLKFFGFF